MAKKIVLMFFLVAMAALIQPAIAQEEAAVPANAAAAGQTDSSGSLNRWIAIACAFGLALASAVCGIGQSNAIRSAVDGIARNPGAADNIRGALIIGLALIESLVIYVLLIAFILLFAKWA